VKKSTAFNAFFTVRFKKSSAVAEMGDRGHNKFVVFWTISTIKDEMSAEKFHYIKTLSGKVVAQ